MSLTPLVLCRRRHGQWCDLRRGWQRQPVWWCGGLSAMVMA